MGCDRERLLRNLTTGGRRIKNEVRLAGCDCVPGLNSGGDMHREPLSETGDCVSCSPSPECWQHRAHLRAEASCFCSYAELGF